MKLGSFDLRQLSGLTDTHGVPIERDPRFKPKSTIGQYDVGERHAIFEIEP